MGDKKKGSKAKGTSKASDKQLSELQEEFEKAGEGLLQSQTDLKKIPWKLTWTKIDQITEKQDQTIEVLNEILKELKKKKGK